MAALRELPGSARCVIIGGGVGGTSIAYHLAKLGWKDVVLVERNELTSGSTFHSAGLVGQLRSTVSLTKMMQYSVGLYGDLAELGEDRGWHRVRRHPAGLQRSAEGGTAPPGRVGEELRAPDRADLRQGGAATCSHRCAPRAWWARAFLPTDGYLDPSQLTFALAEGARLRGAEIVHEHPRYRDQLEAGRVQRVVTERGGIRPRTWSMRAACTRRRSVAWWACDIPITPMSHEYLVTEAFEPPCRRCRRCATPTTADLLPHEVGGLIMGGYERNCCTRPARWGRRFEPAQLNACRRRLGALRGDRDQLAQAGAGDGGREVRAVQRPRGLHSR